MQADLFLGSRRKIVILASSPSDASWLRTDIEMREIEEGLRASKKRDCFALEKVLAARPRDLQRALLDIEPDIVHFCGHGSKEGLVLEDENGAAQEISVDGLSDLFRLFVDCVECVVLNACYTERQAEVIAHHIPYVVGMRSAIRNRAATRFACAFYDALGAGRPITFAFELACNALLLYGSVPKVAMPVLRVGPSRLLASSQDLTDLASLRAMSGARVSEVMESLRTALKRSPSSPELHRQLGKLYLLRHLYGEGQEHLFQVTILVPEDPEAHYYYALALVGGRRLRDLRHEEIQAIEQRLTLTLQLDSTQAKYVYFSALIKYEYYLVNGLPTVPPFYDELLREAEHKYYASDEMEILIDVVSVQDSDLLETLRRRARTASDRYCAPK